jgi:hypothetical protein
MLSRYQNAAAASREYAERFPERRHPGPRQLLIYYSGETLDRTFFFSLVMKVASRSRQVLVK